MKIDMLMSVRGLSVSFKENDHWLQALKDVSFDIPKGKTVCLVGESGCGKSVTARSILRILDHNARIDEGQILYEQDNGTEIDITREPEKSTALKQLRGNDATMIFQEPMTAISSFYTIGNQIIEALTCQREVSFDGRNFLLNNVGLHLLNGPQRVVLGNGLLQFRGENRHLGSE